MIRRRSSLMGVAACASALSVLACSSDDGGGAPPTQDSGAQVSDGSLDTDLPPVDSGADVKDARPPFDGAAETVACMTEPCPVHIVGGQNHFCVLMSNATVRCWGDDEVGQLGTDDEPPPPDQDGGAYVVSQVDSITSATQISAAAMNTCARLDDGGVSCWGANTYGQLGLSLDPVISDYDSHPTPSPVAVASATRIDVGQQSACAILTSGEVWCWGDNETGQLGRPVDQTYIGGPAKLEGFTGTITQTAASTYTAFALDDTGQLWSWGASGGAQGSVAGRTTSLSPNLRPTMIALGPTTSFAVSSWFGYYPPFDGTNYPAEEGVAHACSVVDGAIYCWGDSTLGAMGIALPGARPLPNVTGVRSVAYPQQVATSRENTCARLTDGTIHCAGDDAFAQLGRGADAGLFATAFTPAKVFTDHAVEVALSDTTTCALIQGGRVACWGGNAHGELGQGTTDENAHPTPVSVGF